MQEDHRVSIRDNSLLDNLRFRRSCFPHQAVDYVPWYPKELRQILLLAESWLAALFFGRPRHFAYKTTLLSIVPNYLIHNTSLFSPSMSPNKRAKVKRTKAPCSVYVDDGGEVIPRFATHLSLPSSGIYDLSPGLRLEKAAIQARR